MLGGVRSSQIPYVPPDSQQNARIRKRGRSTRICQNSDVQLIFADDSKQANPTRPCLRRADKAAHCAELGITHFVDDRREVLKFLVGIVPHLYLFGPQDDPAPTYATPTPTWDATEREILATL